MKKIYLITGFLGAGKTTFVNNYCSQHSNVAVVVNEFGKESIDAKLISETNAAKIYEVNNGSIFCSCRMDTFVDTLVQLAKIDVDVVLIEASGLSDPANLMDILDLVNSKTDDEYLYMGSICIIDGINFMKLSTALPVMLSQVERSNYILINKCDEIDEDKIAEIEAYILMLNDKAVIYKTIKSKIDSLPDAPSDAMPSEPSLNTLKNRPVSEIINPKPMTNDKATEFIDSLVKKAYRCKGFITIDDQKYYLDIVGGKHTLTKIDKKDEDKLVLIKMK